MKTYPLYLAGKPVTTSDLETVVDKHTDKPWAKVCKASAKHIESAIAAAVDATEPMRKLQDFQRRDILMSLHDQMKDRFDEIAEVLLIEAGKTIKDARGEVSRGLDTLRTAAEEATRIKGELMPLEISERGRNCRAIMQRVPIGPCSFITPFNFPLNLALHKVAPAIAAGNPFILKPASATPVSAILIGEMLAKTDLPAGAFSVLPMDNDSAGPLVEDDRLKLLSFTGSPKVGWDMKKRCGKKRITLELGGNAACIVDHVSENELDHIADRIVFGAFYQAGQSCISVQRVLIHDSIFHDLTSRLMKRAEAIKPIDPHDEKAFLSPLINDDAAKRIDAWLDEAKKAGAKVLCGGTRKGRMYQPTIVTDVPKNVKLSCEEVFGPVMLVQPFVEFEDAIKITNDSDYGLQAGVFTNSFQNAMQAFDTLEVGAVIINDVPAMRVDSMPYGGVKDSGFGREGLRWAIEEMTELRTMVVKG